MKTLKNRTKNKQKKEKKKAKNLETDFSSKALSST